MDPETSKRKVIDSPGTENSGPTSRDNKARRMNRPEVNSQELNQILHKDGPRGSDLTQKLVAMWVGGSKGSNNARLTQEVREGIALRDSQQKCAEAENYIQKMQQKVESAENAIANLTKTLEAEEQSKSELIEKINATAEVVATITDHINYITDTLGRCQRHKDHLTNLYDNIILRQRDETGRLKRREEMLQNHLSDLQKESVTLQEQSTHMRLSYQNKLSERDAKLASTRAQYENVQKQLEVLNKEKEDLARNLSSNETYVLDQKKKLENYETEIKAIKEQLAEVSSNVESLRKENLQLNDELLTKTSVIQKMAEDLETVNENHKKQLAELCLIRNRNDELEKKLKTEIDEKDNLTKSLREKDHINEDLNRQVEKLKEETSEGMKELRKRIENAEKEKKLMLELNTKTTDEMKKTHENLIKSHVEKYESCLSEMKALEARHHTELSRVSLSSSTVVSNARTETSKLERQLNDLKREKEQCETELQQVENLLRKHTNSELQLKRKLEQCQSEAAALAAAAVVAAENKKRQEEENKEKTNKIHNLENELLKLQFNQTKEVPIDTKKSDAIEEMTHHGKERTIRKSTAASTYQKSILKRSSVKRKARSSPLSPMLPASKKISFLEVESSSDGSPVKLTDTTNITAFMNSDDLFDEMIGTDKGSSQPLPHSQTNSQSVTTPSQTSGKKFFKSRTSQSK